MKHRAYIAFSLQKGMKDPPPWPLVVSYLPPAYVVRREGNSFTLFVSSHLGGVPVSHNALQHFPECHGAAGGGYPARSSWGGYPVKIT